MPSKVRRIIIAGAGRFGREIEAWLKTYGGYEIAGFVDDISDAPDVLSGIADHEAVADCEYVVAIGSGAGRLKVARLLQGRNCRVASVISPHALLAQDYKDVAGAMILGNCSVSSSVVFGAQVLVQGFACVGHDVALGDGVTVSSHVFIGGGARIGEGATLHPGSVILPDVQVGDYAVVGAGSVVVRDVEAGTTVFGNPARMLSRNAKPGEAGSAAAVSPLPRPNLH